MKSLNGRFAITHLGTIVKRSFMDQVFAVKHFLVKRAFMTWPLNLFWPVPDLGSQTLKRPFLVVF
jgi:hypothetical protein